MTKLMLLPVAALALSGVAAAADDELIPRKLIFGNPERAVPIISPDGTQVIFGAPVNGVINVWVAPVNNIDAAKPITNDTKRPIRTFQWAANGTHVLYRQDTGGDENFHYYAVDVAKNTTKDLTPFPKTRADLIATSYDRPDEILIGINNRDERWHDAYIVNVVTGEAKMVEKNEGFGGYLPDNSLTIRLGTKPTPDGGQEVLRLDGGTWKPFTKIPADDGLTTQPLGLNHDGSQVYMLDSRGRDKGALTLVDVATGKGSVIGQSNKADVAGVIADPVSSKVLAYSAQYERTEWTAIDPALNADFAFLKQQIPGEWQLISQSKDNNVWTMAVDNVVEPIKFVAYDRKAKSLKTLFVGRPALTGKPLANMYSRVIKARDGLNLVSYLTLPKGSDPDGNGVPDKAVPLVLNVHGGPWGRDVYGYDSEHQWLANRGYAVLSVNFRASTGFGKAFVNAGDKQWAGTMHNDLLDAVDWAVKNKITTADKVAIYGGSYGGYATLVGLTYTPTTFACGVDIVGPSNLATLLGSVPAYWASFLDTLKRRVGDPTTEAGKKLLADRSPLFKADKIQRPLLIAQGANDPRVKQAESDQIVQAMTQKKLPVTYVLYKDEGHGFARPENRLSFYAISEAFLSQCLGGQFQPVGDDFKGSSVAVPTGAEHIPGLKAALGQ